MTDDPKKRLMDAAMAMMREGLTPTTRELVDRAGVNLSAISYYFQGKDNLMAQALDEAAVSDLERWFDVELDAGAPPEARLEKLALFLGRLHRNFHQIARLQLQFLTLKGRLEGSTTRAIAKLAELIAECRGSSEPDLGCRVSATSLMASLHYMSIAHERFDEMTGVPVGEDEGRDAYVRALLAIHGVASDGDEGGSR